jgi:Anti-sigma-K factor rskA
MRHADARELLELAAAEPGGLDRLAAGDTPDSGALAGHLAGCEACREEYGRLHRTARLLRSGLSTLPPPSLRDRTLARVAAEGRVRTPETADRPRRTLGVEDPGARRAAQPIDGRIVVGWVGSLAAAVALAVGLSWALLARPLADELRQNQATANGLARLQSTSVQVDARPDARRVVLGSAVGAVGTLAFSPSTRELVVVTTGLQQPASGEYRCWVESNGQPTQLGKMYFVGGIAAWEGMSDAVAAVPAGAHFGISFVPTAGDAQPVLTGTLGGT